MLRVYEFDKDSDDLHKISIEKITFQNIKWLDCYDPTADELKKVNELIKIPQTELDRCLDEDERPSVTELENFSMLVFKSPVKFHKDIFTSSFAMLVSDNMIVTIRKRKLEGIDKVWDLEENALKNFFRKGCSYLAYQILEKVMDDYFTLFNDLEKEINAVENGVFESPEKKLVKQIFSIKKTLIYFHKALATNRDVAFNIVNEYAEKISPDDAKRFRYVQEDIVQLIDVVGTYREILMTALDVYLSSVSNNLNNIMKKMAAFGTLILVPTFITGLYGMNFKFLPELNWTYGYLFAWITIIISVILLYVYFKQKDWF